MDGETNLGATKTGITGVPILAHPRSPGIPMSSASMTLVPQRRRVSRQFSNRSGQWPLLPSTDRQCSISVLGGKGSSHHLCIRN